MRLFGKKKYNILVLGSDGMLGYDVYKAFQSESMRKDSNIGKVVGITEKDGFKLHIRHALSGFLTHSIHFDYCINCVAYTNTKYAEIEKDGKDLDYKLNALAPKYIAESCHFRKTKLIHISTDYVFSECSDSVNPRLAKMFRPNDEPFPVNEYGKDKLLGEYGIAEAYGKDEKDFAILRTSWLYGMHNNKSFIHKFLKNVVKTLKERDEHCDENITMTINEKSIPTSTEYLIECIKDVISKKKHGIFHAVPLTNDYGVTRLQFAQTILDNLNCIDTDDKTLIVNGIDISEIKLAPVKYAGHQPQYSAMANTIGPCVYWEFALKKFIHTNNKQLLKFIEDMKQ